MVKKQGPPPSGPKSANSHRDRSRRVVHVAVEGTGTEPDYFDDLRQRLGDDRLVDNPADLSKEKQLAAANDVTLIVSNPSFETWLYPHFANLSTPVGTASAIIAKLRAVAHGSGQRPFEGYDTRDDRKRLTATRLAALNGNGRVQQAAKYARALDKQCENDKCAHGQAVSGQRCPDEQRDPSSGVYRLLEELGVVLPRTPR
jgi:RloB-like protein